MSEKTETIVVCGECGKDDHTISQHQESLEMQVILQCVSDMEDEELDKLLDDVTLE